MNVLFPFCLRLEQLRESNPNAGKWIKLDLWEIQELYNYHFGICEAEMRQAETAPSNIFNWLEFEPHTQSKTMQSNKDCKISTVWAQYFSVRHIIAGSSNSFRTESFLDLSKNLPFHHLVPNLHSFQHCDYLSVRHNPSMPVWYLWSLTIIWVWFIILISWSYCNEIIYFNALYKLFKKELPNPAFRNDDSCSLLPVIQGTHFNFFVNCIQTMTIR